jgi:hypothetical protein
MFAVDTEFVQHQIIVFVTWIISMWIVVHICPAVLEFIAMIYLCVTLVVMEHVYPEITVLVCHK